MTLIINRTFEVLPLDRIIEACGYCCLPVLFC